MIVAPLVSLAREARREADEVGLPGFWLGGASGLGSFWPWGASSLGSFWLLGGCWFGELVCFGEILVALVTSVIERLVEAATLFRGFSKPKCTNCKKLGHICKDYVKEK